MIALFVYTLGDVVGCVIAGIALLLVCLAVLADWVEKAWRGW